MLKDCKKMKNLMNWKEKTRVSHHATLTTHHPSGISLISLIITIIVIIILAAIVIFTGLNTPDRANFAKFVSEFSDFRTAVQQDYLQKKTKYALEGKTRSDAQIYYSIARKTDAVENGDINLEPTVENMGQNGYAEDTIKYISGEGTNALNLGTTGIQGTYAYLISNDTNVAGWKKDKKYYAPDETHWITDEGDVFVLPGYRVEQDGEEVWYLNETIASNTAVNGPVALIPIVTSSVTVHASNNGTGTAGTEITSDGNNKVYLKFTAEVTGEDLAIISSVPTGATLVSSNKSGSVTTFIFSVTKNGRYTFSLSATGAAGSATGTVTNFASVFATGQLVNYHPTSGEYTNASASYDGVSVNTTNVPSGKITTQAAQWRILYEDTTNGTVVITPGVLHYDTSNSSGTGGALTLSGPAGYANAKKILDEACRILYSSGSFQARSATNMDLIKVLGDTPTTTYTYNAYFPNGQLPSGETAGSASTRSYTIGTKTFTGATVRELSNTTHKFYFGSGDEYETYCNNPAKYDSTKKAWYYEATSGEPVIVAYTSNVNNASYSITDNAIQVAVKGVMNPDNASNLYGWLASPCVRTNSDAAYFYVRYVCATNVGRYELSNSGGITYSALVRSRAPSFSRFFSPRGRRWHQ